MTRLEPYYSPIDPILYPIFAFLFVVVGLAFLASFIVAQITNQKSQRNLYRELTMALVASITLGLGGFFVFLASGIYV
ncbi:hypothetical protein DLAC_08080 [Tieghemostelium lacteum]|uniref:Dolichyl-diphosphooligosaccharide-protein glycosyltransferase subunit OST5 n=1 Tax=Tieghemostelium lacteum TaxID=361077 RepID=A0A151ZB50_TIELA|nr:hypothetical protein DLAC_08080 [Tieghemostelium lacteum]|eukprot:KYQ91169.1 hypothetical protein DLAC_08080 [Tieghemostelium lacteum]